MHVLRSVPAAQAAVRVSGPVEGVWGNREVPPASFGQRPIAFSTACCSSGESATAGEPRSISFM